jgi:UDP-glucose 4-epimerase
MAHVLVTGGAGYIGSHTVIALAQAGHEVTVVDDLRRSTERIVAGVEEILGRPLRLFRVDIADEQGLGSAFDGIAPVDAVVHFAAYKSVKESVLHPTRYYRNNIGGTAVLVDTMRAYGCGRIVFSSSCTVYGQPDRLPVDESSPILPATSPYGYSKQVCEQLLDDALRAASLTSVVSLRYFNPAGAHPSALIGELPIGVPDNLVPFITQTAAGWRERLETFGSDYATPDGTAVRDYLHVVDLAEAHVAAVGAVLEGPGGLHVYNLGTGEGVSVRQILDAFEAATGLRLPVVVSGRRPGDVEQVWADPSKAARELGWRTTRSLRDIMASAWAWQQTLGDRPLS